VSCKGKISFDSIAKSRAQLEALNGNSFSVNCPHCERYQSKSPHEFHAEVSVMKMILAVFFSKIICFLLWQSLGIYSLIAFLIPIGMFVYDLNRTKVFNQQPYFD